MNYPQGFVPHEAQKPPPAVAWLIFIAVLVVLLVMGLSK